MKIPAKDNPDGVLIWDLPLRIFHWALVAALLCSWFTIEILEDLQLHFWSGYAVMTLLIFRIIWGVIGTYYSHLRRLFFRPAAILSYLRSWFGPTPQRFAGHNPAGSLAVLAMLCALIAQVATGLFSSDDYLYGPLAGLVEQSTIEYLTNLHHQNFELIKILIALHIVAIALYRLLKKEALTAAMVTGRKNLKAITEPLEEISSSKILLALLVLASSVLLVYLVTIVLAEPVPLDNFYY